MWSRGVQLPEYWDWLLSLQGLAFVERMMAWNGPCCQGGFGGAGTKPNLQMCLTLVLKKELQPCGGCTRCLQGVKFSPHGNEAQWQEMLLLCLGEPALHIQQTPTVFLPKDDYG